jgi:alpha-L-fucosidase
MFMAAAAAVLMSGLQAGARKYEANWDSLAKHNAEPEWLKDAKLGIYFHWGPYAVPAFSSEWYPRNMYLKNKVKQYHEKTFGPITEFGYHDFVPMFTGAHFDPAEWAELFRKAGARFAGPVAEHHDGFAMWASKATPWNANDMGPKRDILGELFAELEKRDIKTIATFHHSRNLQRNTTGKKEKKPTSKSHYPYMPGTHTASDDPKLQMLYGNMPEQKWLDEIWMAKLVEVIDNYQPDIIWFDSWLDQIPESHRAAFCAYYLNAAGQWGKEVVIVRKQKDLPLEVSINDHEKSREPRALKELWMTDDTLSTGSWCYTEGLGIKPLHKIVHALVDTVSKNGVVLLNISPMADGTIPQDQRDVLLGLGNWLEANGEAIYGTRPWVNAAEGPTAEPTGGFSDHKKFLTLEYSAKDIRYTASRDGKTVYATTLGSPEADSEVLLKTIVEHNIFPKSVTLLNGSSVEWEMTDSGLSIKAPATSETSALVFKIELQGETVQ